MPRLKRLLFKTEFFYIIVREKLKLYLSKFLMNYLKQQSITYILEVEFLCEIAQILRDDLKAMVVKYI